MAIEEIRFQAELEFIDDFRIGRPGGLKRRRRGIPAPRFEAARVFEIGHDIIGGFPPHRDRKSHTSELQSLMRISYAVSCLKKQIKYQPPHIPSRPTQHT